MYVLYQNLLLHYRSSINVYVIDSTYPMAYDMFVKIARIWGKFTPSTCINCFQIYFKQIMGSTRMCVNSWSKLCKMFQLMCPYMEKNV